MERKGNTVRERNQAKGKLLDKTSGLHTCNAYKHTGMQKYAV